MEFELKFWVSLNNYKDQKYMSVENFGLHNIWGYLLLLLTFI